MGMGFSHWFGRGARLVLGGPYKHNRRAAAPRARRPLPSGPGKPNRTMCELNQPPGGLAAGGRGLREWQAHFLHVPQLEAYWAVCWAELQAPTEARGVGTGMCRPRAHVRESIEVILVASASAAAAKVCPELMNSSYAVAKVAHI